MGFQRVGHNSVAELNLFCNRSIFWSLLCAYVCQCFSLYSPPHSPTHPHALGLAISPVVLFTEYFIFCCCSEWGLSFQCIFWLLFAYVKIIRSTLLDFIIICSSFSVDYLTFSVCIVTSCARVIDPSFPISVLLNSFQSSPIVLVVSLV